MSLFDVHPSMQGRSSSVADADDALNMVTDDALAVFLDDVRILASAPAPQPTGDLAILLRDGFAPPAPAPRPVARRTTPARRWASRTAVLSGPLGMKIAAAATAAAATFGGAAALGVLPDGLQQWASDVARTLNLRIPDGQEQAAPVSFDRPTAAPQPPLAEHHEPAGPDDRPTRDGDDAVNVIGDLDRDGDRDRNARDRRRDPQDAEDKRRDRAEDAADEERDAAEDAADDERDAAEDAADDDRDASRDRHRDAKDAREDERDDDEDGADDEDAAADDDADDDADAAEDDDDEAAERADDEADAAEEATDEADDAEDGADEVDDAARDAADDDAADAEDADDEND